MADMKPFSRFLFDTWYGALAACALAAAGSVLGALFSFCAAGKLAEVAFGLLLLLAGLVLAASFVRSLWQRAWGRAAAQLLLGLAGTFGFTVAQLAARLSSMHLAYQLGWEAPWVGAKEKNGVVPFEVEYQRLPSFTSEFGRRVAFASGKRIGLTLDGGGHAALSVYALEDGTHALVDSARGLFRVDAAAETVSMGTGRKWFRLPDGTLGIDYWSGESVGVTLENGREETVQAGEPFGTTLKGRRLIGRFRPYGRFEASGEGGAAIDDWLADRWEPGPWWPDVLPFALERNPGLGWADSRWRVAFPSGRTAMMGSRWDAPYTLYAMADGNYLLESVREVENPGSTPIYRIRPADGRVDVRVADEWVEMPEDMQEPVSWDHRGLKGRNAAGELIPGTNAVPVGTTTDGMLAMGRLRGWDGVYAPCREPEE